MAPRPPGLNKPPRRLIVNADDFGRSTSINQAVIRAHREGILTTTSLMVNEPACEEAIGLARDHPTLGVGLHLTLLCGHSALPPVEIPGLVNSSGEFSNNPPGAGFRYVFQPGLLQNARVDEPYVTRLLPQLPPGDSELYSHPSLDEFKSEFDALVSPRVQDQVNQLGIKLIRYRDL
jgi:predicted glycoside hydrolase/deacetylase ChbG (UPF0249 family)